MRAALGAPTPAGNGALPKGVTSLRKIIAVTCPASVLRLQPTRRDRHKIISSFLSGEAGFVQLVIIQDTVHRSFQFRLEVLGFDDINLLTSQSPDQSLRFTSS